MKLCPQCEFIYEDDQSLCDMDGHELVLGSDPLESPPNSIAIGQGASIDSSSCLPTSLPVRRQSRSFAFAAVAAVILAAVLFVVYYARTHQLLASTSNQTVARQNSAPLPLPNVDSVPSASLAQSPTPEQSLEHESHSSTKLTSVSAPSQLPVASPAQKSATRARLASSPVSAGGPPASNRAPVMIRLTNGAAIKADEAWERREGIWYRQAGIVTFLKRNRVKEMDRLAYSHLRPQPAAIKPEEKKSKVENLIAQNQSRVLTPENSIARTEPKGGRVGNTGVKKESRMSSFLKKTGRILSKPFKL